MDSVYDKCSKKMYDTVQRLMKLAEEDNSVGFFELAEASRCFFYAKYSLFEAAVAAGLMARNKAAILGDFLTAIDIRNFGGNEILCHLAGLLIRERRCREAVKIFVFRMAGKLSQKEYILISAAVMDDIEIFKLLYNADDLSGYALLVSGIFKSKKILDHITDCGEKFLKKNFLCDLDYFLNSNYTLFKTNILFEELNENDFLLKWLENIYSVYFSGEPAERSYEILMNIAGITGLIFKENDTRNFYSGMEDRIRREIYILNICGHKINDLTHFIPYLTPPYITNHTLPIKSEYIDTLTGIAGNEPFITIYTSLYNFGFGNNEAAGFIERLAEKLENKLGNKLTVKLVSGFDLLDIEMLEDKVRIEIDPENPKTDDYLRSMLKIYDKAFKEVTENRLELAKYLIDNGFITVEKMTEIASSIENLGLLNMLFNYGNEKEPPKNKRSVAI